jgi:FkbM family methyltransferase
VNQPFVFRPGTNDEAMFHHLITHNEYRLPDQFDPQDIIVDVGVHIGGFSYSALSRGARRVHGFEAEPSNCESARHNLREFGDRATIHNKAVWRSDRPAGALHLCYSSDQANTGGGSVFWDSKGVDIPSVPFDEVLLEITDGGKRRISLLKIDCEGSEFPILLTAKRLDLIDRIAGEFHEMGCARNPEVIPDHARIPGVPQFTLEALDAHLRRFGFEVTWERHGDSSLGLFFATRPRAKRRAWLGGRLKTIWRHLRKSDTPKSSRVGQLSRPADAVSGTPR